MRTYPLFIVDVFAEANYAGNQLADVADVAPGQFLDFRDPWW